MKIKKDLQSNFTIINNEILRSKLISFKAKGLYAYMFSLPDDWNFSIEKISRECKEGEKAIKTAISELERYGLLERRRKRPIKNEEGSWSSSTEYLIRDKISTSLFWHHNIIKYKKYIKRQKSYHCSLFYFDQDKAIQNTKKRITKP